MKFMTSNTCCCCEQSRLRHQQLQRQWTRPPAFAPSYMYKSHTKTRGWFQLRVNLNLHSQPSFSAACSVGFHLTRARGEKFVLRMHFHQRQVPQWGLIPRAELVSLGFECAAGRGLDGAGVGRTHQRGQRDADLVSAEWFAVKHNPRGERVRR